MSFTRRVSQAHTPLSKVKAVRKLGVLVSLRLDKTPAPLGPDVEAAIRVLRQIIVYNPEQ